MPKFFNKPQMGQVQLNQAQRTNLQGQDIRAQQKAENAAKGIDMLSGMAQQLVTSADGIYSRNLQEKHRIASAKLRNDFLKHVEDNIKNTKDFDYTSDDGLKQKYKEYSDSFLEKHKDEPFIHQLRSDLEGYGAQVVPSMYSRRDAISTQKVSDYTSQVGLDNSNMYSKGLMSDKAYLQEASNTIQSSTEALQTPSSSSVPLSEEQREVGYKGLLIGDARKAYMKGVAIQLANPENSKLANLVQTEEFMELVGVNASDEDYQKLVGVAIRKGQQADKANYKTALGGFKEALYVQTNQGVSVDVDLALDRFKQSGQPLTAEDEHKIRKEFKGQNELLSNTSNYLETLSNKRYDITSTMDKKKRESIYDRAFTDIMEIAGEPPSIDVVNSQLSNPVVVSKLQDYLEVNGQLPERFTKQFDIPSGISIKDDNKWLEANKLVNKLDSITVGTDRSVEELIGAVEVSKVRGIARILEDTSLTRPEKTEALELLSKKITTYNTSGYIKSIDGDTVDKTWLQEVASNAPDTTDDYVGIKQNADEIEHYYNLQKLANVPDKIAKERAVEIFKKNNVSFEMPNGDEIAIPKKHDLISEDGIIAYARTLKEYEEASSSPWFGSGDNWFDQWSNESELSISRGVGFGQTQKYNVYYGDKFLKSFSYDDYVKVISNPDKIGNDYYEKIFNKRDRKQQIKESLKVRTEKLNNWR
jgi:hypothetical protein